ncbi:efflux pump [Penicillium sp. IBT 16267x]|nr:efflux pump [Penicillium sp. IBT 16267x]
MAEMRPCTLDGPPRESSEAWQNYPAQKQDDAEKSSSSDNAELKYNYPTGLSLTLILTSVTLAYFLFFLDLAVMSTATPAITSQFNSLVDVGWYGGAYQLGSAAFQSLSGKIYSQFSIKEIECFRINRPSRLIVYSNVFFTYFCINSIAKKPKRFTDEDWL